MSLQTVDCMKNESGITYVHARDLSCVSHFSEGSDIEYETKWWPPKMTDKTDRYSQTDNISLTDIFWSKNMCGAVASLTPDQQVLFDVPGWQPHIPLAKSSDVEWTEIGIFVEACMQATD